MFAACNAVSVRLRQRPTSVENILEDQLRGLVVEGRHTSEELKETHPQRPPVHHAV